VWVNRAWGGSVRAPCGGCRSVEGGAVEWRIGVREGSGGCLIRLGWRLELIFS